jgi:hypothetical protein
MYVRTSPPTLCEFISAQIPKLAVGDQLLSCATVGENPERRKVVIPNQSRLYIDTAALHHNRAVSDLSLSCPPSLGTTAAYWPEPDTFEPKRFIDTDTKRWPRNACASEYLLARQELDRRRTVAPFSAGARSCLGISFAQIEVSTMLAFISRHFIVRLREADAIKPGETPVQARHRILATKNGLTLSPADLALTFERR